MLVMPLSARRGVQWGLTQRQGGGRFTRDEASALIDQLQNGNGYACPAVADSDTPMRRAANYDLRRIPAEQQADELRRRNCSCSSPYAAAAARHAYLSVVHALRACF